MGAHILKIGFAISIANELGVFGDDADDDWNNAGLSLGDEATPLPSGSSAPGDCNVGGDDSSRREPSALVVPPAQDTGSDKTKLPPPDWRVAAMDTSFGTQLPCRARLSFLETRRNCARNVIIV